MINYDHEKFYAPLLSLFLYVLNRYWYVFWRDLSWEGLLIIFLVHPVLDSLLTQLFGEVEQLESAPPTSPS